MTIYIGLLRGINVGGNKKINMAELKSELQAMDLNAVQTYINSGNVLFESAQDAETLRSRIEQQIQTAFGMSVTVVLRTAEELCQIIEACPYSADALTDKQSIQITLLTEAASQKTADLLAASERGNDEYLVNGKEIYFLFRQSMLDSKLANAMNKLGKISTTRNWNTIVKLAAMAKKMKDGGKKEADVSRL